MAAPQQISSKFDAKIADWLSEYAKIHKITRPEAVAAIITKVTNRYTPQDCPRPPKS